MFRINNIQIFVLKNHLFLENKTKIIKTQNAKHTMKTKQKTTQTQNPKNNLIKTPILTTLLLTIFTLFTFNDNAHANMFNKFKKGFYFENQSKSSIISYLEQNYPVGSSVKELIVEMKKAGAQVEYFSSKDSYSFCLEEVHSSTLCEDSKYANYIIRYLIDENNMGFWQKIRGIKKQLIRIAIKVEEGNDKIITHKKHTGDYVEYTKHTNDTGLFMKKMDKSGLSPRKAKEYAAYSDKVTLTRKKDMFFSVAFINIYNEFKFQKYDNGDYAKDALLIMHPIGSDVGELVKTLDIATGREKVFDKSTDNLQDRISKKGNYFYFDYYTSNLIIFSTEWRALVTFDIKNPTIITNIETHKFLHSL